jgi:predicted ATPase/class 3 adenylate cyclase
MAERFDPEEWAEIMNEAFSNLSAPIGHYEGTIARLMGDAILAFFGAPSSHEDDPQRAILAGLEIIEGIRPFRERLKRELDLDFNVRVGINTGQVVVGEVGSNLASEYTAMGDAVNLAARMEQAAQPGTVQISGATHRLVAPLFECEDLGPIEVKGKSQPVPAYRVLGRKASPGRLRGIAGLAAPLIGRAAEMDTLREVIAGVRQGRGQIVCIIGEAGLGKSRILEELRAQWQSEAGSQPTWAESRGVSYDSTRPYSLFTQRMRQFFGMEDDDLPKTMREKIAQTLQTTIAPEQLAACIAAVQAMLAVREESDKAEFAPDALKREVFGNMLSAWRAMGSRAPFALVFDDLHWSDAASAELIIHLFQLTEEVPILLLFAFRPERQSPAWLVKQQAETQYSHRYVEIDLKPLSPTDTDALVSNLLVIADLPPQLRRLILQKTEGNPFFVEEVVRTLIDTGAVVRDESGMHWRATTRVEEIAIPDNVQALLMARIDRLQEKERRTLQLASVIGRYFYRRILEVISETLLIVDKHLSSLEKAELIREAARSPELEYMFRHELTRDAAYNSILRRQRRQFHRRVGKAIEALFPDRLEGEAHRLAFHFHEGGADELAIKYYTIAGDTAARLNAHTEAIFHYTHALEIANSSAASQQQITYLDTRRARALELSRLH